VTGDKCREIFKMSGLSNAALMEIWDKVAEKGKDYLRRTHFFAAMKAIAIYQKYNSIEDYDKLIDSPKMPLPDLTHKVLEEEP